MDMPAHPPVETNLTPGIENWGRVYAFVLAVLAFLIMLFTWLTRLYS